MAGKRASFADVAAAAGVSIGTVDRVINGRGNVKAETEQKVLKWARELRLDRTLSLRPTRILKLGVLLQTRRNPFYEGMVSALKQCASDYSYLNVQIAFYFFERLDYRDVVEKIEAAARACDGLLLDVFEHPQIRELLTKLATSLPVFTLASDIPDIGSIDYIGVDARAEGRVAGELMGRFVGAKKGEVLLISGLQSFHAHEQREMGFRSVLRDRFPNCTLAKPIESREDKVSTELQVKSALAKNKNIVGIYNISVGSREISEFLQHSNRSNITFITHELTAENRTLLKSGFLDAVIDQDHASEARLALQKFLAHYGRYEGQIGQVGFRIYLRENC
ncbi:LacI family DNA-binding transcriptional regulator [Sinorhizobium prairiense]|uniref:LacI family DNA-binding transcriptional regulator n=1 Tax=unclassified Sinorhizobium TaxID=2613772 RepID=UPI0023D86B51|nr:MULTISPECIES: LacI family DNA-binding transcriptional regulator [unclassified Sinorhizobium]WEJ08635.1 LacI family DNA-binding transcriptional regulator [Sinorhizobium sp. M103]WEJ13864.1 LacI family DNA-binding transcriptional regulator [Sinorhizobium sp. K101]WEJ35460.1 LacI family DNA-binding transcriptional regulator [Sinorhizobium sp. C101]